MLLCVSLVLVLFPPPSLPPSSSLPSSFPSESVTPFVVQEVSTSVKFRRSRLDVGAREFANNCPKLRGLRQPYCRSRRRGPTGILSSVTRLNRSSLVSFGTFTVVKIHNLRLVFPGRVRVHSPNLFAHSCSSQ